MSPPFSIDQPALRISFGADALLRVAALDHKRVFVIATRSARAVAGRVGGLLGPRCVDSLVGVNQHVPVADAQAAVERVRAARADCIVAIGGGSAIGLAKAVALSYPVAIVAVPTTYSGSELSSIYGITGPAGKRTGRDKRVRPRVVIYDPSLTTSLSPEASAASGMNALAHCVEALYAPDRTPMTSLFAVEGASLLVASLPKVVGAPDDALTRSDALLGAMYAGLAMGQCSMGLHHRICHVLGGTFGLPHGHANAVMLPRVARFNTEAAGEELSPLTELFEGNFSTALVGFVSSLGLPTRLDALGFDPSEAKTVARLVLESPVSNPRSYTIDDVVGLTRDQ